MQRAGVRGPHELDKRAICALMMKITRAVAYAHQRGIIHRDIKPANILVDGQGNPRLLDFGLARLADDPWVEDGDVTEAGEVMGTPSYMSPEQTMGRIEEIDLRSDVYSIGVLFLRTADEQPAVPHRPHPPARVPARHPRIRAQAAVRRQPRAGQ